MLRKKKERGKNRKLWTENYFSGSSKEDFLNTMTSSNINKPQYVKGSCFCWISVVDLSLLLFPIITVFQLWPSLILTLVWFFFSFSDCCSQHIKQKRPDQIQMFSTSGQGGMSLSIIKLFHLPVIYSTAFAGLPLYYVPDPILDTLGFISTCNIQSTPEVSLLPCFR